MLVTCTTRSRRASRLRIERRRSEKGTLLTLLGRRKFDWPKFALVFSNRLIERLRQVARYRRTGNDPGKHPLLRRRVLLAKVEHKLIGVEPYAELVGITSFKPGVIFGHAAVASVSMPPCTRRPKRKTHEIRGSGCHSSEIGR